MANLFDRRRNAGIKSGAVICKPLVGCFYKIQINLQDADFLHSITFQRNTAVENQFPALLVCKTSIH